MRSVVLRYNRKWNKTPEFVSLNVEDYVTDYGVMNNWFHEKSEAERTCLKEPSVDYTSMKIVYSEKYEANT